ncbi:MAG: hypothetical protein QNK37_27005 [Acidobacteriota bacterium]|nr:hypothetical protein [Acidobacteriota bacterium]
MKYAPLFTACYDLLSWLLDRTEGVDAFAPLNRALITQAVRLTESITLALQGFDADLRIGDADEAAALLRLHLRLAADKDLLTREQQVFAVSCLDEIGRQIGGWLKYRDGLS